ncbi:MAG: hypothetical protein UT05_C0005G0033 [Parcubacteria group bacterium GW2011_GWF2_38_76]|nr:MAG: hypothetical protein UT05_C0005G0033 [Parcubacteria group bacterium GW2011_GWF2_38_76]HBM45604.1 hypothetical protein [Patescibacteria group bacterium]
MKSQKIKLTEGIDRDFFNLLFNLYYPMLSKGHLKDRFQYTIKSDKRLFPIGFISVTKKGNSFMQFALIPEVRGQGIAIEALKQILKYTKTDKLGWSCNKANYPSLKFLSNLEGGIFEGYGKVSGKNYEGFCRPGKKITNKKMSKALMEALPKCKEKYSEWLKKDYLIRKKELKDLNTYLSSFNKK